MLLRTVGAVRWQDSTIFGRFALLERKSLKAVADFSQSFASGFEETGREKIRAAKNRGSNFMLLGFPGQLKKCQCEDSENEDRNADSRPHGNRSEEGK